MVQEHAAGIAGDAARRCGRQEQAIALLDHRPGGVAAGIGGGQRRRRRAELRTGGAVPNIGGRGVGDARAGGWRDRDRLAAGAGCGRSRVRRSAVGASRFCGNCAGVRGSVGGRCRSRAAGFVSRTIWASRFCRNCGGVRGNGAGSRYRRGASYRRRSTGASRFCRNCAGVRDSGAGRRCRRDASYRRRGFGASRFRRNYAGSKVRTDQRRRVHVYRHLVAISRSAGVQLARQRALRHHPQRVCTPLRGAALGAVRRLRRYLLQRRLQRALHHRSHLR